MSDTRLTIDLAALAHNYRVLQIASGKAQVAPVLKADGYGLGAVALAQRLLAAGATRFFVARVVEGEALRAGLGDTPAEIIILDGAPLGMVDRLQAARLTPALSTLEQARSWDGPPAVLHVDTGMNRLGVSVAQARALADEGFACALVMSHLGNGNDPEDPRNTEQLALFQEATSLFPGAAASLAASAGVYLGADYLFDVTRPGISLFGGGPREVPHPDFKAVATLETPILQLRDLQPGDRVAYGSMFTADRPMRIAVLGAGYADGIIRRTYSGAKGWLRGAATPFVSVSMDLITVDVSHCPDARVGDPVELLGANARLDDLAAAAGSVAHECLVRLSSRAERVYIN